MGLLKKRGLATTADIEASNAELLQAINRLEMKTAKEEQDEQTRITENNRLLAEQGNATLKALKSQAESKARSNKLMKQKLIYDINSKTASKKSAISQKQVVSSAKDLKSAINKSNTELDKSGSQDKSLITAMKSTNNALSTIADMQSQSNAATTEAINALGNQLNSSIATLSDPLENINSETSNIINKIDEVSRATNRNLKLDSIKGINDKKKQLRRKQTAKVFTPAKLFRSIYTKGIPAIGGWLVSSFLQTKGMIDWFKSFWNRYTNTSELEKLENRVSEMGGTKWTNKTANALRDKINIEVDSGRRKEAITNYMRLQSSIDNGTATATDSAIALGIDIDDKDAVEMENKLTDRRNERYELFEKLSNGNLFNNIFYKENGKGKSILTDRVAGLEFYEYLYRFILPVYTDCVLAGVYRKPIYYNVTKSDYVNTKKDDGEYIQINLYDMLAKSFDENIKHRQLATDFFKDALEINKLTFDNACQQTYEVITKLSSKDNDLAKRVIKFVVQKINELKDRNIYNWLNDNLWTDNAGAVRMQLVALSKGDLQSMLVEGAKQSHVLNMRARNSELDDYVNKGYITEDEKKEIMDQLNDNFEADFKFHSSNTNIDAEKDEGAKTIQGIIKSTGSLDYSNDARQAQIDKDNATINKFIEKRLGKKNADLLMKKLSIENKYRPFLLKRLFDWRNSIFDSDDTEAYNALLRLNTEGETIYKVDSPDDIVPDIEEILSTTGASKFFPLLLKQYKDRNNAVLDLKTYKAKGKDKEGNVIERELDESKFKADIKNMRVVSTLSDNGRDKEYAEMLANEVVELFKKYDEAKGDEKERIISEYKSEFGEVFDNVVKSFAVTNANNINITVPTDIEG